MGQLSDDELRSRLAAYSEKNRDHWSFRGNSVRRHAHAYFQYPAMMVPQMVGDLLAAVTGGTRSAARVYDPFAGSGTALTEAMMRGLDFSGQDINPLAVLLCHAKTIPFFDDALADALARVTSTTEADRSAWIESDFPNRKKWFTDDVAVALSRLQRNIRAEKALWVRRFLWVALAETVRLCSNSRTSTFKLHIRATADMAVRKTSAIDVFKEISSRNLAHLRDQKQVLTEKGHLNRGRYKGVARIRIADSGATMPEGTKKHGILITSPPYGDNVSTVPYGQHSYLPLQWIDLADIDTGIDHECLKSTHEIDRRSLGGSNLCTSETRNRLRAKSRTLAATVDKLRHDPADRAARVFAFCRDLEGCMAPILAAMQPNAIMIWILGNRLVGGKPVPLDSILTDFLMAGGARPVLKLKRRILSKRMAVRNNIAATMRSETIVVMRKGSV
jgi:hypothetical protein